MRPRHIQKLDLGEAISMEDAISMMTIIFVLFVVFLVPLISIDKARLEQRVKDDLGQVAVRTIGDISTEPNVSKIKRYASALELGEVLASYHTKEGNLQWFEGVTDDSTLVVIKQNMTDNSFKSFSMSKGGETVVYRHGDLGWSKSSSEWFILDDAIDYGDSNSSKEILGTYRRWRGGSK